MFIRQRYLDVLLKYKDAPIVKILAGIRRCGKSTILEMFKNELIAQGCDKEHIIHILYTSMEQGATTAQEMHDNILKNLKDDNRYYLLLDEIQEIDGWEKVVNSLLENHNVDIYVTGSNSRLMSSEISTYLTGRYVSIPVYPLSFEEYISFKQGDSRNSRELLNDYIRYGGFPIIALGSYDQQTAYQIVEGIYSSVVQRDIALRHSIPNQDLFNRVVRYILENVGKTFSANAIVKFLKSENRSLTVETIYNYLEWLEKAFVIYRCSRYDLQGKSVLKTQEKFYLADSAIKYSILGYNPKSVASILENLVYFELRRKGYDVYIGKNETKEIDFVAVRREEKVYVQVCRNLPEDSDREIDNLLEIRDNHPKYVVTLDDYDVGNREGIKIVHMADFLLLEQY